jgi:hypothetical protein
MEDDRGIADSLEIRKAKETKGFRGWNAGYEDLPGKKEDERNDNASTE